VYKQLESENNSTALCMKDENARKCILPCMDFFLTLAIFSWKFNDAIRIKYMESNDRMINECGVVSGMRIGMENRSIKRKLVPLPLCSSQIPHDRAWDRNSVAAVGSRRLTA
jgi:hypothetical protein